MKKTVLGFAAVLALGFAAFAAPASAAPVAVPAAGLTSIAHSAVTEARFVHHGRHCTMRTVVRRGPHGRRIVNKVRVCR